jgi:hypothetical protein
MKKRDMCKQKWTLLVRQITAHMKSYPSIQISFPVPPGLTTGDLKPCVNGGVELTINGECTDLQFCYDLDRYGTFTLVEINLAQSYGAGSVTIVLKKGGLSAKTSGKVPDQERVIRLSNAMSAMDVGRDVNSTVEQVLDLIVQALLA